MSLKLKRYLISTLETFWVTFWVTFLTLLQTALENGNINQTILVSIAMASFTSSLKIIVKSVREFILEYKWIWHQENK